jgi:hypothetical protein
MGYKQKAVDNSIVQKSRKWTMTSPVVKQKGISCAEAAIAFYESLYPKRSTVQIGIDLGVPEDYNW